MKCDLNKTMTISMDFGQGDKGLYFELYRAHIPDKILFGGFAIDDEDCYTQVENWLHKKFSMVDFDWIASKQVTSTK